MNLPHAALPHQQPIACWSVLQQYTHRVFPHSKSRARWLPDSPRCMQQRQLQEADLAAGRALRRDGGGWLQAPGQHVGVGLAREQARLSSIFKHTVALWRFSAVRAAVCN